jgi:outer membrane protein assembly factor BamB
MFGIAAAAPLGVNRDQLPSLSWRSAYIVDDGPTQSGRSVLVVSTSGGALETVAINASDGETRWTVPTTLSAIPPAEFDPPVAIDGVALVLTPSVHYFDGYGAELEGIDVATGAVKWSEHGTFAVFDAPTSCPGPWSGSAFCVVLASSPKSPLVLVAIDAATGRLEAKVPDIARRLAPGLYGTATNPPSLIDLALPTGVKWVDPVAKVFGSALYTSNAGWRIGRIGDVVLVTFGHVTSGGHNNLDQALTVALALTTGRILWRDAGSFECGSAADVDGPYLCVERGTVTVVSPSKPPSLTGGTVVIAGIDVETGKLVWRHPIGDPYAFITGEGIALSGASSFVVPNMAGHLLDLDVESGRERPVAAKQSFWCRVLQTFRDETVPRAPIRRTAVDSFVPCTADRKLLLGLAGAPPSAILAVGHLIWVTPEGLRGVATPRSI